MEEIPVDVWDDLSAGQPFQSHRWYRFGERVMQDCEPLYLLAYQNETLVGRASLWKIRNEPLPIQPGAGRALLDMVLRRWPLLICRSPLSNTSGLILPSSPLRADVRQALSQAALSASRQMHCLLLMFDFLSEEQCRDWPPDFWPVHVSGPGMVLRNRWDSLEAYLADGDKKDRQHYKRTLREAEKRGIKVATHKTVADVDAALKLIHLVDARYGNEPNPWARGLLESMEMVDGTWLEARQEDILVGCGALFEDNGAQLTTALGLAENVPYAYLLLTYASLQDAFSKQVRLLRWGSGAYDVKQKLGFEMEDTSYIVLSSNYLSAKVVIKLILMKMSLI